MKHFYNLINKDIEQINIDSDILALMREEYYTKNDTIKDKFSLNNDFSSISYDVFFSKGKPMKWTVKDDKENILEQSKILEDGKEIITIYKENKLFKKITFSANHTLIKVEYFDLSNDSTPIDILEPRRSNESLCILYNSNKLSSSLVLYPLVLDFEEDILNRIKEKFDNYYVIAKTDDGTIIYLSNEQKEIFDKTYEEILEEIEDENKPKSFIDEEDISLGSILNPKDFNLKRNLASNIDISKALEFVLDSELDENVVEKVEINTERPDKVIESDKEEYKYFGELNDKNQRHGYGRTTLNEKTAYEGYYVNDKREGKGSYYYKDGTLCYSGDWVDNKRNGIGVGVSSKDRSIHIGSWVDNKPVGNGIRLSKDGDIIFINKVINDESYIQITFKDNEAINITQYDNENNLLSTKGFNIL